MTEINSIVEKDLLFTFIGLVLELILESLGPRASPGSPAVLCLV